jgi:hypothetical protein
MFVPLAPAAKELGVGIRRPCRGQACGGMIEAMARIAPAGDTRAKYRSLTNHVGFISFRKMSNFCGLGCSTTAVARDYQSVSHQISQFYVQLSSGFRWTPL